PSAEGTVVDGSGGARLPADTGQRSAAERTFRVAQQPVLHLVGPALVGDDASAPAVGVRPAEVGELGLGHGGEAQQEGDHRRGNGSTPRVGSVHGILLPRSLVGSLSLPIRRGCASLRGHAPANARHTASVDDALAATGYALGGIFTFKWNALS